MVSRWQLWVIVALIIVIVGVVGSLMALTRRPVTPIGVVTEPLHEETPIPSITPLPSPIPPTPSSVPTATPAPLTWRLWRDVGYVPILMYHYVRVIDEKRDPLGFRLSVRPDRFAEQMDWLATQGYQPMTVSALAECLREKAPSCPERPVALTFDDGYDNHATEVLPILRSYGYVATFYIISGDVGREGYVTWEQLRELRDAGMEIGAHTVSHAALTALSLAEARAEIVNSKAEIEQQLNSTVTSFSYPSGDYNEAVAALVREAGFTNAVTTVQEGNPVRLDELPRRRVLGGEVIAGYKWYFVPVSEQK